MDKFYDVLGVPRWADINEIRAAYKKRAATSHPDRGGSDQEFCEVNRAYEVLSNPNLRAEYDRKCAASASLSSTDFMQTFMDSVHNLFTRPRDPNLVINLTLTDFFTGCSVPIKHQRKKVCLECKGSGLPLSYLEEHQCKECRGSGRPKPSFWTLFTSSERCEDCYGQGFKVPSGSKTPACKACDGTGSLEEFLDMDITLQARSCPPQDIILRHMGDVLDIDRVPEDLIVRLDVSRSSSIRILDGHLFAVQPFVDGKEGQSFILDHPNPEIPKFVVDVPITLRNGDWGMIPNFGMTLGKAFILSFKQVPEAQASSEEEELGLPRKKLEPLSSELVQKYKVQSVGTSEYFYYPVEYGLLDFAA